MEKIISGCRVLSKWLILLMDQVIISWSFAVSYFMIKQFEFTEILRGHFFIYMALYTLISLAVFFSMRIHTGIIRYSNTHDILRIFTAVLSVSIIHWIVTNFILDNYLQSNIVEVNTALFINFFMSSTLLVMLRIGVKGLFILVKNNNTNVAKECILIYGSNRSSLLIKQALEATSDGSFNVVGFIDEDYRSVNKYIEQKKVFHLNEIETLKNKHQADKLLVMSEDLKSEGKKKAIERCIELGVKVFTVPPTDQWLYGKLQINQLQDLKIEDLLQRDPIVIQTTNILTAISGKRVLITGAAGSIGSEIVRQVMTYFPEQVILCDQAESPLHELQLEMEDNFPDTKKVVFMGDIQNYSRMKLLFKEHKPQIVFHAAAYKHVPMMENNPAEAILTNVLGTKNIADLSVDFEVEKFIMISTDKAVNPTNVMGASKRIAEIYAQSLNNLYNTKTKFITTRFGNVLGSNGSVIPRFRSQIKKGGPITVTHPEITRYFMTIPESVQLVLEAGAMGNGGEIYIFDMGEPVKITHLAEKMIKLSGFVPHRDIKIVYTGLRPGEKLYEELLHNAEEDIPTHHEKIKISKVITYQFEEVERVINDLISINKSQNHYELVKKMKEIVPEFKSNNSIYEQLDLITN
ncbi:polysaccharide biosynthesis protein [Rubrolithibacter danxiaensis]|uniref:polysaccharide biosynthesis protein n=1 Tax=Rubrolithibacter danxiaensis TaxID=3390805 RepID=UPI003BF8A325